MLKRVRTSKGIHPDLNPTQFNATSFPHTFSGVPSTNPTYGSYGNWGVGMPKSLKLIQDTLANQYIEYLNSFDTTLSLSFLSE